MSFEELILIVSLPVVIAVLLVRPFVVRQSKESPRGHRRRQAGHPGAGLRYERHPLSVSRRIERPSVVQVYRHGTLPRRVAKLRRIRLM